MADEQALTIKQRKFVRFYLQTGNASQSALKAGYKNRMSAFDTLTKPYVQSLMLQIMEQKGITDKKLANVLKEGLSAKRVVAIADGDDEKRIEVADLSTRHKYLETALKIKGNSFEKADQPVPIVNNVVSVVQNNVDGMNPDDIRKHISSIVARRFSPVEGVQSPVQGTAG